MRFSPINPKEFIRIVRMLARDAVLSPLRRYVFYSIVLHVVVIGALSAGMFFPKTKAAATPTEAPTATSSPTPAAAPAAEAPAEPAQKPADAMKPTGNKEDYYNREKIETAKPSEIPRNPFDAAKTEDTGLDAPPRP